MIVGGPGNAVVVLPDDKCEVVPIVHQESVVPHPVITKGIPIKHRVTVSSINNIDNHYVPSLVPKTIQLGREGNCEVCYECI
jgi:hypothetical protein